MIIDYFVRNYNSFKNLHYHNYDHSESEMPYDYNLIISNINKNSISAIIGPNNCGKSNFIRSLKSLKYLIMGEISPSDLKYNLNRNNNEDYIEFRIIFSCNEKIYDYCIIVKPLLNEIYFEELTSYDGNNRERLIITVKDKILCGIGADSDDPFMFFDNDHSRPCLSLFSKSSFLIPTDILGDKLSLEQKRQQDVNNTLGIVFQWFVQSLIVLEPDDPDLFDKDADYAQLLDSLDTGIDGVKIVGATEDEKNDLIDIINKHKARIVENDDTLTILPTSHIFSLFGSKHFIVEVNSDGVKIDHVLYHHSSSDDYFELGDESEGIKRIIEMSSILFCCDKNKVYVIDELDRKLHTNTVMRLIEIFSQKKDIGVQLIFTTHESSFLSSCSVKKKNKWIIDKTVKRGSILRPMANSKIEDDIMEDYLIGKNIDYWRLNHGRKGSNRM